MRVRMGNRSERSNFASNFESGLCLSKLLQDFLERAASICSQAASGRSSKSLPMRSRSLATYGEIVTETLIRSVQGNEAA